MLKGPIIIVDDDPDDQMLISDAIRKADQRVALKVFNSGEGVIEYLAEVKENPFIIFCDIKMPRIDGISLREMIEAHPGLKRRAIPFVYITGSASAADVKRAYELSVQGFFTKPNSVEEWEMLVGTIFSYWNECIHPNSLVKTDK